MNIAYLLADENRGFSEMDIKLTNFIQEELKTLNSSG